MPQSVMSKSDVPEVSKQQHSEDEIGGKAYLPNSTESYVSNPDPDELNTKQVQTLQRIHGNHYVSHMMQHRKIQPTSDNGIQNLSAQFNVNNKLQRMQSGDDEKKEGTESQDGATEEAVDTNPQPQEKVEIPEWAEFENSNQQIQQLDQDNDMSMSDEMKQIAEMTGYDPSADLASKLDAMKQKWESSGQVSGGGTWDKIAEVVGKLLPMVGGIGAFSAGIAVTTGMMSAFGVGLPITPIIAALSAQSSLIMGATFAGFGGFLANHHSTRPIKGQAATNAWGATLDKATQHAIIQTKGNAAGNDMKSVGDIDRQMADIRAGKALIATDITDAKTKYAQSLEMVTSQQGTLSSLSEPLKNLSASLKEAKESFSDTVKKPEVKDSDEAKQMASDVKGSSENAPSEPIMRSPKISVMNNQPSIQRMIYELVVRPIIVMLRKLLQQALQHFLSSILNSFLAKFIAFTLSQLLNESGRTVKANEKQIAINERKAEAYQNASDDLLDKLEQDKKSLISTD